MQQFHVVISPLISVRAVGVGYAVNVFPEGYGGFVPVRYFMHESDLAEGLRSLGVSPETQAEILNATGKGKHYFMPNVGMDLETAALFGWTP